MPNREFTSNTDLWKKPQYHKIKEIIKTLEKTNRLQNFVGNCVAAADVMQHLITHAGIPCKIVECQACLIKTNPDSTQEYIFVGYDHKSYPGHIDTHAIVVTTDEHPLIVDLSLAHVLPHDKPYVVERLNGEGQGDLGEYNIENVNITYQEKKNIRLPSMHQKSLLDRILYEQKVQTDVDNIRWFALGAAGFSVVNMVLILTILFIKLTQGT
jgi:hypothetical protein